MTMLNICYAGEDAVVKDCLMCDFVYTAPPENVYCPNCASTMTQHAGTKVEDYTETYDDRPNIEKAFLSSSAVLCA